MKTDFLLQQAGKIAKKCAMLSACVWLLLGCEPAQKAEHEPSAEQTATLSRALYSGYLQLDPQFVKVAADGAAVRDLLEGLVAFNPQGEIIPALAREWFSEDGQHWLFILDDEAKWSNGEAVTAYDIEASWQRLADPANHSPLAYYLVYLDLENAKGILQGELPVQSLGVHALNRHSLQIKLQRTQFNLPEMLGHIALLPTYHGLKPQENVPFISNGSYHLHRREKHRLMLQANTPDIPFQQVHYQLIRSDQNPDPFDLIENPRPAYLRDIVAFPRLCTYFYEFNFRDPFLKQREIRQAIRAMLSPTAIAQHFGLPNHSALPKTRSLSGERQLVTLSPEQIFRQKGINHHQPMRLTLLYDGQGQHQQIALRVARELAQSDLFRITLQELDWKSYQQQREAGNFQLSRASWCADYDDPVQFLIPFHSQSPDNKSGYQNAEVDRWLEQLQQSNLSKSDRDQLMANIVRQLEQDVAMIPLFQYLRRMTISKGIKGFNPTNHSEVIYSKDLFRE